jgi:uncharacterized membrane protein
MPGVGPVDIAVIAMAVVVFVAIPITIVLLVVHLLRSTPTRRSVETDHAVEIARERFARGEITLEDYERALRALGRPSRPGGDGG